MACLSYLLCAKVREYLVKILMKRDGEIVAQPATMISVQ